MGRLHALDWSVIIAYLVAMVGVGFWFMRRNGSSEAFFKGNGRIPWIVVSLSIYATLFSSITFLSVPAFVYATDMRYYALPIGTLVVAPIVVRWYLPYFRRLNLTSAYEYLEVRFNLPCRILASAVFVAFMIARTAIVTYLPAVALAIVTGIGVNAAIVIVMVTTVLYCTIGGIEAVIWSDFVQALLLIGSAILILVLLISGTEGGMAGFVSMGLEGGKFRAFDMALDWTRPTFWVVFVGGLVTSLASYTSDQCVVQRYMTTADERGAAKSILVTCLVSFVIGSFFFLMGVALWTFYRSHPELLPAISRNDQILPAYIVTRLPHGVVGLVLAAIAAATMSTLSTNLNSTATAFTTDFYVRLFRGRRPLLCARVCSLLTGVLGGGFALWLANTDIYAAYDEFQRYLGVLSAGLGVLFLMGIFMRRVTGTGALCGLVANYIVTIGLDRIAFPGHPHMMLYGAIGMVVCLVVAQITSSGRRQKTLMEFQT